MKALVINGSPHRNGATSKTLNLIKAKLGDNFEYETIHAYDLKIKPCLGCLKCRPDKDCILPKDDGHLVGSKLKEADLLILGTPSYWSNMPAPLKLIFDRNVAILEYCLDKPPVPNMVGKKAIVLVTCASDEINSEHPLQLPLLITNLHYILKNSGYDIVDTIEIPNSWNINNDLEKIEMRIDNLKLC